MVLNKLVAAIGLFGLGTAGCGGGGGGGGGVGGGGADAGDSAAVLATTSIWADVASGVGCGVEIPALIPPGADPHTFEPSLRDRGAVERAATVIANGLELEASVEPMLQTAAGEQGVDVIEMTIDIDVLSTEEDDTEEDEAEDDEHPAGETPPEDDGHAHAEGGDPHVWQDPRRVAGTLDTIATALAANDISTCTDAYRAELVALDAEIEALLAAIPDDARVLVTSHDSLAYFADRYGFEIVGTVIPSTSTLVETNAADLAELAEAIEAHDVPAIFTEELESTADADALAERLGVEVVPIVTDSLTDDPATDTYVEMMRHNATLIAEALAP
jgi:zinc/manganese transport system substrate-binding protein